MLLEKELSPERLVKELDAVLTNENRLKKMKQASSKLGIPDASDRLYQVMVELANSSDPQ